MRTSAFGIAASALAALTLVASAQRARAQANAKDDDDDEDVAVPPPKHHHAKPPSEAAPTEPPPKLDQSTLDAAKSTLVTYLDAVKAKKWKEVRALTHPKTLETIAQVKRRLGEERHSMAPWYWAKDNFYLKAFTVQKVTPAVHGTVVVDTSEDSYQIQEGGDYTGEKAAYLLGQFHGRWYVVDKMSEGDTFTADTLKYGYPGYFDGK